MTYDEALDLVRREYPNWLIRTTWIFDGDFYFNATVGDYFCVDDLTVLTIIVNSSNGKITELGGGYRLLFFMNKDVGYKKRFDVAALNDKPVDLTSKQYEELLKWRKKFAS